MAATSLHDFTMTSITGDEKPLSDYAGKVLLVVNVASQCGFTRQYTPLQELHDTFKDRGFAVIGFPSNDFGGQEPGSNAEIQKFCDNRFDVTFDLFSKIPTKGSGAHPLYQWLTSQPGHEGDVSWNFNKFLVDKDGKVVARYASSVEPNDPQLVESIESLLNQS